MAYKIKYLSITLVLFPTFTSTALGQTLTWQQIRTEVKYLFDIHAFDANKAIAIGPEGEIIKTTDGGETWSLTRWYDEGVAPPLRIVEFVNDSVGWIAGDSSIVLKTTDQGETWNLQDVGRSYDVFWSCFLDESTGWLSDWRDTLLTTQDGGQSWQPLAVAIPGQQERTDVKDVFFINADTGWVIDDGLDPKILKTTDGGHTWQKLSDWYLGDAIYFVDANKGWICGYDSSLIATTDGGATWEKKFSKISWPASSVIFGSISFATPQTGWIAGERRTILKTTDGGENWHRQNYDRFYPINNIHAVNESIVWAAGEQALEAGGSISYVVRTTDGGTTWSEPGSGTVAVMTEQTLENHELLLQNHPNPFNPSTEISYELPASGHVKLEIHNALGQMVATIDRGFQAPGKKSLIWHAQNNAGVTLPSGQYFYRLIVQPVDGSPALIKQKKMSLVR